MDVNRLIAEVFKRPALWNQRHTSYHNRDLTCRIWTELSVLFKLPKQALKNKWKGLRDTFRAEMKKEMLSRKMKYPRNRSLWVHFKPLQFLKEQMLPKPPVWSRASCPTDTNNDRHIENGSGTAGSERANGGKKQCTRSRRYQNRLGAVPSAVPVTRKQQHGTKTSVTTQHPVINDESAILSSLKPIVERNQRFNRQRRINVPPMKQEINVNDNYEMAHIDEEFVNVTGNLGNNDKGETLMLQEISHPEQVLISEMSDLSETIAIDPLGSNNHFDDNYFFLMSLLPHVRSLPAERRMHLRMQMQQLVYQEVYKRPSNHEHIVDYICTTTNDDEFPLQDKHP